MDNLMTSKNSQPVTLNNRTCSWFLKGGHSTKSLGFIFQTPCIFSLNFTTIHPAFVETFPRCINLSVMSEEKSGDHQSQSCVSTKLNGNPSDACRDILTKLTKQDFYFSRVKRPASFLKNWMNAWSQTHIWRLNLNENELLFLFGISMK